MPQALVSFDLREVRRRRSARLKRTVPLDNPLQRLLSGSTGCQPKQPSPSRRPASERGLLRVRAPSASTQRRSPTLAPAYPRSTRRASHRHRPGPKFQPDANAGTVVASRSASIRYPRSGSSTNCHGRYADGFRIRQGSSRQKGSHQIGNQLIAGPVTAADGIAGARAAQRHAVAAQSVRRKKRLSVRTWSPARRSLSSSNTDRCPPIGSFSRYPHTHSRFT